MGEEFLGADLKVDPGTRDLVLDGVGEPTLVKGRACLAQDLRHRLTSGPEVLGFLNAGTHPGKLRDLVNVAEMEAEKDPRVVPGTARAVVRQADLTGTVLELEVLPVGEDTPLNLVVRVGGV